MSSISLKIRILDKEYQVNCKPEEREALELSAKLLDEKMEEIRRGSHLIGSERIAVMAALNLAHDLIRSEQNVKSRRADLPAAAVHEQQTQLGSCGS